jgi:hypothetical protein
MHSPAKTGSGDAVTQRKNAELAYRVRDKFYEDKIDMAAWVSFTGEWLSSEEVRERVGGDLDLSKAVSCGTSACIAGWACLLAGDKFVGIDHVMTPDGAYYEVPDRAAILLGLDEEEADLLFYDTDDDEVPAAIEAVFGPDPRNEDQLRVTIEEVPEPGPRAADSSARTDG